MDSTAKLTWMFVIAVVPLVGAFLLWFTQGNFVNRKLKERILSLIQKTQNAISQPEDVIRQLGKDHSGTVSLGKYLGGV